MLMPASNNYYEVSVATDFYSTLLSGANIALAVSALVMIATVLLSYPLAELLSMQLQIVAHIATIIAATILKISYVLRCIALNGLGEEVR
ncbi:MULTISPECIES: hypothetical protein [Pseudoalteromonas]|uniref:hypothetical protein n=1 Tax=Pseudoalteromonas TaxID=53246 RepID=UPI00030F6343|nr:MULTISPECIES: hypothetical protein [Pseudoalteromonas]MCF6145766.1 hypothetical protein [Pseudoalteromonas mariniglutinosa NCIMB 1770]